VLAAYHLAIGIRRTDGIEPADPQQNPGDNMNLALAVTASSPAAAVTSPAITPAKCGRRMPGPTKPGHDKYTPSRDNGTTDSWKQA
jgi:hypothetical protein